MKIKMLNETVWLKPLPREESGKLKIANSSKVKNSLGTVVAGTPTARCPFNIGDVILFYYNPGSYEKMEYKGEEVWAVPHRDCIINYYDSYE